MNVRVADEPALPPLEEVRDARQPAVDAYEPRVLLEVESVPVLTELALGPVGVAVDGDVGCLEQRQRLVEPLRCGAFDLHGADRRTAARAGVRRSVLFPRAARPCRSPLRLAGDRPDLRRGDRHPRRDLRDRAPVLGGVGRGAPPGAALRRARTTARCWAGSPSRPSHGAPCTEASSSTRSTSRRPRAGTVSAGAPRRAPPEAPVARDLDDPDLDLRGQRRQRRAARGGGLPPRRPPRADRAARRRVARHAAARAAAAVIPVTARGDCGGAAPRAGSDGIAPRRRVPRCEPVAARRRAGRAPGRLLEGSTDRRGPRASSAERSRARDGRRRRSRALERRGDALAGRREARSRHWAARARRSHIWPAAPPGSAAARRSL